MSQSKHTASARFAPFPLPPFLRFLFAITGGRPLPEPARKRRAQSEVLSRRGHVADVDISDMKSRSATWPFLAAPTSQDRAQAGQATGEIGHGEADRQARDREQRGEREGILRQRAAEHEQRNEHGRVQHIDGE
jgi:hypothetical protein